MPPQLQTIELAPMEFRALITPKSANQELRTVDLTWSTGAGVIRYDWNTGKYIERLSMDPSAIRLERLNMGAPLLDTHEGWSVRDQLGAVVPNSAVIVSKQGRCTVQFSRRDDAQMVFQDVVDGVVSSVSVGYLVHAYKETPGKDGGLPTRLATDWEPYEVSLVPMPADIGARTRSSRDRLLNPCVITRGVEIAGEDDADRTRRLRLAKARRF